LAPHRSRGTSPWGLNARRGRPPSLIPTVIDASVDGRLAQAIEAAAYFFVSEAIANVAKHARASRIVITLAIARKRLLVTVADDGVGGPDLQGGTGLQGLCDRLDAVRGTVVIHSPRDEGTRLHASIPLAFAVARA
jgi:signal transduction histidine kinase